MTRRAGKKAPKRIQLATPSSSNGEQARDAPKQPASPTSSLAPIGHSEPSETAGPLTLAAASARRRSGLGWGAVAAVLGALLSVAQVALVVQQNEIMSSQNALVTDQREFLISQTRAAELEAISGLLFSLDSRDTIRSEIAETLLGLRGDRAVEVVRQLRRQNGPAASLATNVLVRQAPTYDLPTTLSVLRELTEGELEELVIFGGSNDSPKWRSWRDSYLVSVGQFLGGVIQHAKRDSLFFVQLQGSATQDQLRRQLGPLFEHLLRLTTHPIFGEEGQGVIRNTMRLCRVRAPWQQWSQRVGENEYSLYGDELERLGYGDNFKRIKAPPTLKEVCDPQ